jgi:CubicO group peptidase (beta-lactamase class C family)
MRFQLYSLLLIPICSRSVLADLLVPSYESPVDIASNKSLVSAAWRNATATLNKYLRDGNEDGVPHAVAAMKNITFSVGMFSVNDPAASKMQFHYTSPEIANAPNGTNKVDGNTIYRMASVTKAFTVLAGLLELNGTHWDRPITDFVPTLANYTQNTPREDDPTHITEWDKVTLSALAAQIAGVPRDPFLVGEIIDPAKITSLGLPPLNPDDPLSLPPCALPENYNSTDSACNEIPSIESIQNRPPTLLPWTSPAYANTGFVLLGVAIANITGKPLADVYRESIFEPLGMKSSNASTPPKSEWHRSVIPDLTAFDINAGILISSGGLLSTTNDMAKFGIGILNSTLLPDDETRKWLKPVSHTAHFQYSIGRPWEILRYTHASGVITDIYTKLGDSGAYSGFIVLLPDYNAGFSILSGSISSMRFSVVTQIAEVITDSIVPALAAQAAKEADKKFAGVYNSTVPGLESSLTLSVNHTVGAAPGVVISSWTSNGTDVLAALPARLGPGPYRLVPSISDSKSGTEAFRLVASLDAPIPLSAEAPKGLFTSMSYLAADWILLDSPTYGGIGISLFVFKIGSDGNVEEVRPEAFRVSLKRTDWGWGCN